MLLPQRHEPPIGDIGLRATLEPILEGPCMGVLGSCSDTAFFPASSLHRVSVAPITPRAFSLDRITLVTIP